MKFFIVLLVFCSSLAHPGIHSNRVDDDARSSSDREAEFSKKLDEMLTRLDKFVKPLATLSAEERAVSQKLFLVLVDFERTEEDRRQLANQLIQKEEISEEEMVSLKTTMDLMFLITKPFAKKTPLCGKLAFSTALKMITNDEFVFGSQATRKRILLEKIHKVVHEVQENPKLLEEYVNAQNDEEFILLAHKGFGFQF